VTELAHVEPLAHRSKVAGVNANKVVVPSAFEQAEERLPLLLYST